MELTRFFSVSQLICKWLGHLVDKGLSRRNLNYSGASMRTVVWTVNFRQGAKDDLDLIHVEDVSNSVRLVASVSSDEPLNLPV